MVYRTEFTTAQRNALFTASADTIQRKWQELGSGDHFFFSTCGFVPWNSRDVQADHEFAAALGGYKDHHPAEVIAPLSGPYPDIALACHVGVNAKLLCSQCNASKQDRLALPDGMGYAFTRSDEDRNPDHRHQGLSVYGRR